MRVLIIFFLFSTSLLSAQNDSVKGNVLNVREKLIFLNDSIENRKLWDIEGDYGHYGFSSPEFTFLRFDNWWYNTYWVHYLNYERKYNPRGQLVLEKWFDKKDSLIYQFEYKYDKNGNQIQRIESSKEGEDLAIVNFSYNNEKLLRTKVRVYLDSPEYYFYTVHYYDEKNNLIQSKNFDEYGESGGMKYEYDDKGRKIKQIEHWPYVYVEEGRSWIPKRTDAGSDHLNKVYVYDKFSNLIKEEEYKQMGDNHNEYMLAQIYNYTYDYKNRRIKSCLEMADLSLPERCTFYKYYSNNFLERKDGPNEKIFYKYVDSKISELIYEAKMYDIWQKRKVNFIYEFDSQGNWKRQTKIVDGVPLYMRVREIEYLESR